MDNAALEKLTAIIKDKTKSHVDVMEAIGNQAIEDGREFLKKEGRVPQPHEIINQYKDMKDFENILGIADIKFSRVEKFIVALLDGAEPEDFKVSELEQNVKI
jgi:hypothetical protein